MLQDIIRLPRLLRFLQRPLAQFISTMRAPKSQEGYKAIGGGSPLRRITMEQVGWLSGRTRRQASVHNTGRCCDGLTELESLAHLRTYRGGRNFIG